MRIRQKLIFEEVPMTNGSNKFHVRKKIGLKCTLLSHAAWLMRIQKCGSKSENFVDCTRSNFQKWVIFETLVYKWRSVFTFKSSQHLKLFPANFKSLSAGIFSTSGSSCCKFFILLLERLRPVIASIGKPFRILTNSAMCSARFRLICIPWDIKVVLPLQFDKSKVALFVS